MKKVSTILFLTGSVIFFACKPGGSKSKESAGSKETIVSPRSPADTTPKNSATTIKELVSTYLQLKNALTSDNGKEAARAADEMKAALTSIDENQLDSVQKKSYDDLKDDIKEHTEHIGANASDIEHQREHFEMLSGDMMDLVNALGTTITLYKDYCPMYNENKGGAWLSESKEISNPYLGKKMPKCGEVKAEIRAKE